MTTFIRMRRFSLLGDEESFTSNLSGFTADSKMEACFQHLLYILIVCLFNGLTKFFMVFREQMRPLKSFFPFCCWKPTQVSNLNKK